MNLTTRERDGTEPENKGTRRENFVAGVVGAFLGSLLGVACIVILGQMGYVAAVSGLVMAVCSLKGYEKLAGGLSTKGAVVSTVLVLVMTYLANRLDWAISAAQYYGTDILEAFRAVSYLLERGAIDGATYWGNLVMLYLFTLVGAVPTIVSGLRGGARQEVPESVRYAASGQPGEAPQLQVYAPQKGWMTPLRVSASVSMLLALITGITLMAIAGGNGGSITYTFAALGAFAAAMVMMFAAIPCIRMCYAAEELLVRSGRTLWRVNLGRLNSADTYRFTTKWVAASSVVWRRLQPEEQEWVRASIARAISTLTSGALLPGSALSAAVVPLADLEVEKETKWGWKISYLNDRGQRKKRMIPKAYENFAPAPGLEPPQMPPPAHWGLLLTALLVTAALAGAGAFLGGAFDEGVSPVEGHGKRTAAHVPESGIVYELDCAAHGAAGMDI